MHLNMVSSGELADMRLEGLVVSRQSIEKRAKRESWPYQEVSGQARGGKLKKYLISGLPAEIQTAIKEKQAAELLAQSAPVNLPAVAVKVPAKRGVQLVLGDVDETVRGLNDKRRACAYARMALVAEVLKIHRGAGLSLKASIAYVIGQLEAGLLPGHLVDLVAVANHRSGGKVRLGARSLLEWTTLYQRNDTANGRLAALAPKPARVKTPMVSYVWLPYFRQFYALPTKPKFSHSYCAFADWWLANNMPVNDLPSIDQVRRVWKSLPPLMQERGRSTGAELKRLAAYVKRDWITNLKPNDVWIIDGHSFKARVASPRTGKWFKPEVTLVMDGCTRVAVGYSVGLAESGAEVANAIRHAVALFGLCLVVYSDNGAGETALRMDHETTGIFSRLGVRHETGIAGNPQGRGIIERWWKDNLIWLARTYPTFTGDGMDSGSKNLIYRKTESAFNAREKGKALTAEQQRYLGQLPSLNRFLADVAKCVDDYNNRPHSELPRKDNGERFSPLEYRAYRMALDDLKPDFLLPQELDTLFMPQEERTTNRGWLDLYNNQYFSMELVPFSGKKVRVSYDMCDAGFVMVYQMDGTLICKAKLDGNKRDAFPKAMIEREAEKRAQRKIKRAEEQIRLAHAEKNPAIEQANVFDELFSGGLNDVIEHEANPLPSPPPRAGAGARRTGTDDGIVLWAADLD